MKTDREAMKQALDALEEINKLSIGENAICLPAEIDTAMDALRERLAQPEQDLVCVCGAIWEGQELVSTPLPRRVWQGLTDEEPVANIRIWHKNGEQHAELWNWDKGIETLPDGNYDLYTTPPQRKPLTDEEIQNLWHELDGESSQLFMRVLLKFARAIEAAHGIKGEA